jgi:Response regulator containing CheY-like receiver, AAA-type ATPase, and DNA-binding domains
MLKTLLTEANFDTREARDGIEAIELLNSLAADVVLLDLKMPRLGGMAALHRIRQRWPVTKVIVFSGEGTSADETPLDKALVAGADFLLEKPVSRDGLLTALQLVLSQA